MRHAAAWKCRADRLKKKLENELCFFSSLPVDEPKKQRVLRIKYRPIFDLRRGMDGEMGAEEPAWRCISEG